MAATTPAGSITVGMELGCNQRLVRINRIKKEILHPTLMILQNQRIQNVRSNMDSTPYEIVRILNRWNWMNDENACKISDSVVSKVWRHRSRDCKCWTCSVSNCGRWHTNHVTVISRRRMPQLVPRCYATNSNNDYTRRTPISTHKTGELKSQPERTAIVWYRI